MATTHTILPTRPRRVARIPHRARTAPVERDAPAPRPISELDEAHRRMKRNMQALGALLHLPARGSESPDSETLLTELEHRLQAMAAGLRSRCRAGNFEQIELAVYLRQATRLWNTPPGYPPNGGWSFDSTRSLVWRADPDQEGPREPGAATFADLETALESAPPRFREAARRALYSCAVTFPPWFFNWRSTDGAATPGPRPASELRVWVRFAPEGVKVLVSLSGVGPGLPRHFDETHHRTLARQLAAALARLVRAGRGEEPDAGVEFEVGFAQVDQGVTRSAAA